MNGLEKKVLDELKAIRQQLKSLQADMTVVKDKMHALLPDAPLGKKFPRQK